MARSENGETPALPDAILVPMTLDPDSCYRALRARDPRFDGVFFVAVTSTGIYCRPICPAPPPARRRCEFFARAAEAEREGFRACLRCRPELAPGLAPVDSLPQIVRRAAARIDEGFLDERSVDDLAGTLGVTSRHLRRAMEAGLGVSPIDLAQTRRLALAKRLLHDTAMPIARIAHAAGFASLRRFNTAFKQRFACPPTRLRARHAPTAVAPKSHRSASSVAAASRRCAPGTRQDAALPEDRDGILLRLDYRPPLELAPLLEFLAARAIPGVETVRDGAYRRTVALGDVSGTLAVTARRDRAALDARVSSTLASKLPTIVARLRALFDLDARPDRIAAHLKHDPRIAASLCRRPGLRVPGAFDPFEVAVRAVLGQQVTVKGATTLSGRLVEAFGRELGLDEAGGLSRAFPAADVLARASLSDVRSIGLPAARARTIVALARGVADGSIELRPGVDPGSAIERLLALPGIGPWTAQYVAMRALACPDAFPAGDLAVRKALDANTAREAEALSAAWRPWRAYAVMHLWTTPADASSVVAASRRFRVGERIGRERRDAATTEE